MNRFIWKFTKVDELNVYRHSLLQYLEPHDMQFWCVLHKGTDGLYAPIVINSKRNGYITTLEHLSLKDAKEAVEKKLLDDGVIQDGDIIEDETE